MFMVLFFLQNTTLNFLLDIKWFKVKNLLNFWIFLKKTLDILVLMQKFIKFLASFTKKKLKKKKKKKD